MSRNFKIFIISILALTIGFKSVMTAVDHYKIQKLTAAIYDHQVCNGEPNIIQCSHDHFLTTIYHSFNPLMGQEFLANILKKELETSPERGRFLRDQYFIFTADFYINSLRQKSMIGFLPFIHRHNIDVHVASAFLKTMTEHSNRREVERTIASESILQEVSNFNSAEQELTRVLGTF